MKLRFFGHACVLLEAENGCRVIFDPFQPAAFGGRIALEPFRGPVDAVVSSHRHLDHYHIDPSFGSPILVEGPGQVRGVAFSCIQIPHGRPGGVDHGMVTVFRATADGVRVVHLGDAGRAPTQSEMDELGRPDVLLAPVGGRFTMGPAEAAKMVRAWGPRIVVPIHYADPLVRIDLEPLESFLVLMGGHEEVEGGFDVLAADDSTATRTVVVRVLQPRRHT